MKDIFSVRDKCIVITGGAGVLCGAIAEDLAAANARVCIADYDYARAEALAGKITATGGYALPIRINVLDRNEVSEAFTRILHVMGSVDALINGAGGNKKDATTSDEMAFHDMPAEVMRGVFDLNFMGTLLPSQVFGRYFSECKRGNILNISSMSALRPLTRVCGYSAAKAAVSNFTQWLAVHLCQNCSADIRVNAIAPGFFLTEQNRFLLTDQATGQLTQRGQTIIAHTPAGRFGSPEDLFGAVRWLLSDASRFVTGAVIPIDGGFSAFGGV